MRQGHDDRPAGFAFEEERGACDHITASDHKDEGQLRLIAQQAAVQAMHGGDLVLCRTAKPLVMMAFEFVRGGRLARIIGEGSLKQQLRLFFNGAKKSGADPKRLANVAREKVRKEMFATGTPKRINYFNDFYDTVEFVGVQHWFMFGLTILPSLSSSTSHSGRSPPNSTKCVSLRFTAQKV